MTTLLIAEFACAADYLAAHEAEISAGGLLVRGAALDPGLSASGCTLSVRIAGRAMAELPATIASVAPGLGVAVIFLEEPVALLELAARLRDPAGESAKAPPVENAEAPGAEAPGAAAASDAEVDRLSFPERIRLAQTGSREVRMKLLRDPQKQLHAHVLKNPRLTLEEVQWAARQVALAPDALKLIAEHAEWGNNPMVATALVRNPKTPVPLALKLLGRLPLSELRAIAKGNARPPIVQAVRKLLAEG